MESWSSPHRGVVDSRTPGFLISPTWEFPKTRGTLFWGPYNKDPTIWGTILGSPTFGNSHISGLKGLGLRVSRVQ